EISHHYDVWKSPDIEIIDSNGWQCAWPMLDAPNKYVKVAVKIRNQGTDTSNHGYMYTYWSKAGTGQSWPKRWTKNDSNMVVSPPCGDSLVGDTIYYGGQINSQPRLIGPIAP